VVEGVARPFPSTESSHDYKVCSLCHLHNIRENFQPPVPLPQAHVNLVRWSQNIGTRQFPKDDKNVSPHRTPESIVPDLVGIAEAETLETMNAATPRKRGNLQE